MGRRSPPDGFFVRDLEDALQLLAARARGLPLHLKGASSGGYWAQRALSRLEPEPKGVRSAVFEDVWPHLLKWADRAMPAARPLRLFFRTLFPKTFRYFDLRHHASRLRVARVTYVSGERDPGIRSEETRDLARLVGTKVRIVHGAGHLEASEPASRVASSPTRAPLPRAMETGCRLHPAALGPG